MSWCSSPTLYETGQRWQRCNINKIWDWGAESAVGCLKYLTGLGNDSLEYEIPGKMEFQQIQESEHGSCDSFEVSCHLKKEKKRNTTLMAASTMGGVLQTECYWPKTWVCSLAGSKANLLTLDCGEGKCSVYCKVPYKESGTASAQKAWTPRWVSAKPI